MKYPKYVMKVNGRTEGSERWYVRKPGCALYRLPGPPGSPGFDEAYVVALQGNHEPAPRPAHGLAAMKGLETVRGVMASWPQASADGQRILVPTHCIYPSNGAVIVYVECGRGTYLVHDNGGACDEVESVGATLPRIDKLMRHIVSPQGLQMDESGLIRSKAIPETDLLATILLVANVSKEVAHELLWIFRPRTKRNFGRGYDEGQSRRFIEAARELGADQTEEAFDDEPIPILFSLRMYT